MFYDRDEERNRRELAKAAADTAKLEAMLAEKRRIERAKRNQLLNTTRHETWHAHRLAYQDRQAGFVGEMAEARFYLRSLPVDRYVEAIVPYVDQVTNGGIVDLEFTAVCNNRDEWTKKGSELLFERARIKYEAECLSFEAWAIDHPDKKSWRNRNATREQWMLIRRTADALCIDALRGRVSCGDAYDWLQRHGANVRFRPPTESPDRKDEPGVSS